MAVTSGWLGLNDFVYCQALAFVAAKMGLAQTGFSFG
jgi:hypothetical protein